MTGPGVAARSGDIPMATIQVRHKTQLMPTIMVAIMFFGACAAAFIGVHRFALDEEPAETVRLIYLLSAVVLAAVGSAILFQRDRERTHWTLSDSELVAGARHPVRIPLSGIVAIAAGVPGKRGLLRMNNPWRESGIVFKTADGKIVALNLATSKTGRELMDALLDKCSGVFVTAPAYTDAELAILHALKWNRVIDIQTGLPS